MRGYAGLEFWRGDAATCGVCACYVPLSASLSLPLGLTAPHSEPFCGHSEFSGESAADGSYRSQPPCAPARLAPPIIDSACSFLEILLRESTLRHQMMQAVDAIPALLVALHAARAQLSRTPPVDISAPMASLAVSHSAGAGPPLLSHPPVAPGRPPMPSRRASPRAPTLHTFMRTLPPTTQYATGHPPAAAVHHPPPAAAPPHAAAAAAVPAESGSGASAPQPPAEESAERSALRKLASVTAELLRYSPGLYQRAVAELIEPPLWADCEHCHYAAARTLCQLTQSPDASKALLGGGVLARVAELLPASAAATQLMLLAALRLTLQHCPEAAVGLALGGGVSALLTLHRRRRAPRDTRQQSLMLLCTVASHSEVGAHCLQLGVLSPLLRVLASRDDEDEALRMAACDAALALLSPRHSLLQILQRGELTPLLVALHEFGCVEGAPFPTPAPPAEMTAFVRQATLLLEERVAASSMQRTLRNLAGQAGDSPDAGGGADGADGTDRVADGVGGVPDTLIDRACRPSASQLEATVLLCRFTSGASASPLVETTLVDSDTLVAITGATSERCRQLQRASALVLSWLLRTHMRNASHGVAVPTLAVHAALATFDGLASVHHGVVGVVALAREDGVVRTVLEQVTTGFVDHCQN